MTTPSCYPSLCENCEACCIEFECPKCGRILWVNKHSDTITCDGCGAMYEAEDEDDC